jgi:type II secretory pathway component PulC
VFHAAILQKRSLPSVGLILALIYFAYAAFTLIRAFGKSVPADNLSVGSEQQFQNLSEQQPMDFLIIKDWHLFGNYVAQPEQAVSQQDIAQESALPVKLLGVFFLPDQKNSYAIIETDDHLHKKFRTGDEVSSGVTVQSITKQQVMLLRNDQREFITLDRKKAE